MPGLAPFRLVGIVACACPRLVPVRGNNSTVWGPAFCDSVPHSTSTDSTSPRSHTPSIPLPLHRAFWLSYSSIPTPSSPSIQSMAFPPPWFLCSRSRRDCGAAATSR